MSSKILTTCPNCQAKLTIASERAGNTLRCPRCGEAVRVPDEVPEQFRKDSQSSTPAKAEPASNVILVVPPINRGPEARSELEVRVRRGDGGSIQTVLSPRIILNQHSSLRREWVTIDDPYVPAELTECIGLKTIYRNRTDYQADGYFYTSKFYVRAHTELVAFQVKFLTIDIWGEHRSTLVVNEVRDIAANQPFLSEPEWSLYSENETSEFFASIAFISKVRTKDGKMFSADHHPVIEEARRFSAQLKETDFEPTPRRP